MNTPQRQLPFIISLQIALCYLFLQVVCSSSPKAGLAQGECRLITFSPKHSTAYATLGHPVASASVASTAAEREALKSRSLPRHRLIFDPSVLQQRQAAGAAGAAGGLTEKDIEVGLADTFCLFVSICVWDNFCQMSLDRRFFSYVANCRRIHST